MDEDDLLALFMFWWYRERYRPMQRRRRWWVHPILQLRREHGAYYRLVRELQLDNERFHQYFRMSREEFARLLQMTEGRIAKKKTQLRETISARQRLAICIWFVLNC